MKREAKLGPDESGRVRLADRLVEGFAMRFAPSVRVADATDLSMIRVLNVTCRAGAILGAREDGFNLIFEEGFRVVLAEM
ncbi:MAG: hypothetical protein AAGK02_12950 [Pseudomonadota bacterium]